MLIVSHLGYHTNTYQTQNARQKKDNIFKPLMKKNYIEPTIQTVKLPGKGILTVVASNEDTYRVQDLDTGALTGEEQSEKNTLTEKDFL